MPARVIELFTPETWRAGVSEAVREFIPARAIKHLKRGAGENMFHDTLEYLAEAYNVAGDYFGDDTRARLIETVLSRFDFFRSYHRCRPLALESYFRDGLLPLTHERLAEIAFNLFEGTIPRTEIDARSQAADLSTRLGHVYFTADRDELISHCGHYLIYGPEALCCLWRDEDDRPTSRFRESQERHRTRGVPTVFECNVPVAWIPDESRSGLASTLVTQYFQLESRRPVTPKHWSRNWGYGIERDLPAKYIRHHSHPEIIPDPLCYGSRFHNPHRRCSFCFSPGNGDAPRDQGESGQ